MRHCGILVIIAIAALSGCCTHSTISHAAPDIECPTAVEWTQTELFFGMMKLHGGTVGEDCWRQFLDTEIVSRFPDGLTVFRAEGRYLDANNRLHKEPSRVVVLLYPKDQGKDADLRIRAIATKYITDHDQESVMRLDSTQAVTFVRRKTE